MILTPLSTTNRPGLSALQYRVGTFSAFYQTMLSRLSSEDFPALAGLAARTPDDPAIALLDGWSALLDILTFYQERIANEGYLRTATERTSILELARLTGYTLNPGVAASVYLAYTMDKGKSVTIPAGSRAQSMAAQGTLPESFETSVDLDAADTYNSLGIRKTQPSLLADDTMTIYVDGTANNLKPNDTLLLVSETGPVPRRIAAVEFQPQQSQTKVTLQPSTIPQKGATPQPLEAIASTASATAGLAPLSSSDGSVSDSPSLGGIVLPVIPSPFAQLRKLITPLSKPPAAHPPNPQELVRSVASSFTTQSANTPALLKTLYPSLEPQLDAAFRNAVVSPPLASEAFIFRVKAGPFGSNAPLQFVAPAAKTGGPGTYKEWDLQRVTGGGSEAFRLDATITTQPSTGILTVGFTVTLGETTFTQAAGAVSQSAPMTVNIPAANETIVVSVARIADGQGNQGTAVVTLTLQKSDATLTLGQGVSATGIQLISTSVVPTDNVYRFLVAGSMPSTGTSQATETGDVLWLDAPYDQIQPNTWVALDGARSLVAKTTATSVASRADYGLVGRVTRLSLDHDWIDPSKDTFADVRNTTVYAQAESLTLREETIDTPVSGERLELDNLYTGLDAGRWIIVQGERVDLPGVTAAELVMLAGVDEDVQRTSTAADAPPRPGEQVHSFLNLTNSLAYEYTRDSFTITANVVHATHGQSCSEIIGSGDSSQAFQNFALHQKPLTYVSAATATGSQSTLDLRVNDVLWSEAPQLLAMGPTDRKYLIQTDDSGTSTVVFGDGTHGLRVPTGTENIQADYRTGLGVEGNVDAQAISLLATRPLGVRSVINPIAAVGGADPESRDQARQNIPVGLSALNRLVSVQDYEDFSRGFAGVTKASAVLMSTSRPLVYLTIAGADGTTITPASDLYVNLTAALRDLGDLNFRVEVAGCELLLVVLSSDVAILPDYLWEDVEPVIRAALLDLLSFQNRDLGQDVLASEVIAGIQAVEGVNYVDLQTMAAVSRNFTAADLSALTTPGAAPPDRIVSNGARYGNNGSILPAQLAFLSPDLTDLLILNRIK
jgi:predicted phage baseplate assembly protein